MAARDGIPVPAAVEVKSDMAGNWRFFKDQWVNYNIATGLCEKDEKIRVATLLTVMGKDCYQIFTNLNITDENRKKEEQVLKALTDHFEPTKNVIYERYIFNTTEQKQENVDEYVCKLRELARSCDFGAMTDQMVRDRIVLGTRDNSVRKRLLREPDLTLDRAITLCRTSERTATQIQKIASNEQQSVNYASGSKYGSKKGFQEKRNRKII